MKKLILIFAVIYLFFPQLFRRLLSDGKKTAKTFKKSINNLKK